MLNSEYTIGSLDREVLLYRAGSNGAHTSQPPSAKREGKKNVIDYYWMKPH